jgi:hypothetical protein
VQGVFSQQVAKKVKTIFFPVSIVRYRFKTVVQDIVLPLTEPQSCADHISAAPESSQINWRVQEQKAKRRHLFAAAKNSYRFNCDNPE